MTNEQSRAIAALQMVTFPVASGPKRFSRDMGNLPEEYELSQRQDKYLWWVAYRFRRQIADKQVIAWASERKVPLDELPPPKPRKKASKEEAPPQPSPLERTLQFGDPDQIAANRRRKR